MIRCGACHGAVVPGDHWRACPHCGYAPAQVTAYAVVTHTRGALGLLGAATLREALALAAPRAAGRWALLRLDHASARDCRPEAGHPGAPDLAAVLRRCAGAVVLYDTEDPDA